MVDPEAAAKGLAQIFPDLDAERLLRDFTGKRKFVWIKKKISPEQKQAVHDIGDPGLLFGPREMRLYPNGRLAAHVLGGASFGKEGVNAAEVIGVAGVEKQFDALSARSGQCRHAAAAVARPDRAGGGGTGAAGRHEADERQGRHLDPDGCAYRRGDLGGQPARFRPQRPAAAAHLGRRSRPTARCSTARCRGSTSWARPSRSSPSPRRWTWAWSAPTR